MGDVDPGHVDLPRVVDDCWCVSDNELDPCGPDPRCAYCDGVGFRVHGPRRRRYPSGRLVPLPPTPFF